MPTLDEVSPSEDPAYLAFLRAQGYTEANARAEANRRTGVLDRQLAAQMPTYDDQLRLGLENTAGSAEASGVLNSGKTLVDQQQVATDVGRARNAYEAGVADQKDTVIADLTRQLADIQRQNAEVALNTRGNQLLQQASGMI